ncbi:YceI family protein, partial [Pseudoxanthomonas sp. SGD-10]
MRYIPFILLLFVLTFSSFSYIQHNTALNKKWVLLKGGSLQVKGSTNVNKFSCDITGYNKPDTLKLTSADNNKINLRGKISLDVSLFDCHHPVMTADLRKTLKTKEYPRLNINFLTLDKLPALGNQPSKVRGLVDIELAGKTKRYEVDYKLSSP